jgi:hypothetical protein
MGCKIKKRLQVLNLLETSREDFKKEIKNSFGGELLDLLEKGINPVKQSNNRQTEYSESYKKQIEGKLMFFKKGGKLIAIEELSKKELKSYRASKSASEQNAKNSKFLAYSKQQFKDKKVRPVNLKLTGALHESLKIDITRDNPYVEFSDPKAIYHNDVGVGPKKTKRRLLPTASGEEFTLRLFQKIKNALQKAIKKNI